MLKSLKRSVCTAKINKYKTTDWLHTLYYANRKVGLQLLLRDIHFGSKIFQKSSMTFIYFFAALVKFTELYPYTFERVRANAKLFFCCAFELDFSRIEGGLEAA